MRLHLTTPALFLVALAACVETPETPAPAAKASVTAPIARNTEPAPGTKLIGPAMTATKAENLPGLHNVVTYHEGLYCGAVPEGEEGFESLEKLGVRTVISVDGTVPDLALAKEHGLRYVHLPITYNGMNHDRTLEIARAVKDLPGPIYLHCHHGKHRSAAAAGAACVTLGYLTPAEATEKLKISGTAPNYKGLWECVDIATPASDADMAAAKHSFPEVTTPKGLVPSMVAIDNEFDNLKAIEKAGWKVPADDPDLVPAAVAGRIENIYRELAADQQFASRPADFHQWLLDNQKNAQTIEDELSKPVPSKEALAQELKSLSATCNACHTKYRN